MNQFQMQLKTRRQVPCQAENKTNPNTLTGTETGSVASIVWNMDSRSDRYETGSVTCGEWNESRHIDRHSNRFRAMQGLKHLKDAVTDTRQVPWHAKNETNPDTVTGTETGSVPCRAGQRLKHLRKHWQSRDMFRDMQRMNRIQTDTVTNTETGFVPGRDVNICGSTDSHETCSVTCRENRMQTDTVTSSENVQGTDWNVSRRSYSHWGRRCHTYWDIRSGLQNVRFTKRQVFKTSSCKKTSINIL